MEGSVLLYVGRALLRTGGACEGVPAVCMFLQGLYA